MSEPAWKQFLESVGLSEEAYAKLPLFGDDNSKAAAKQAFNAAVNQEKEHQARMRQLQQANVAPDPTSGEFSVYVLDQHHQTIAMCKFTGEVPRTRLAFWAAVGMDKTISQIKEESAHVSVKTQEGWKELGSAGDDSMFVNDEDGVVLQVAPLATPSSSPISDTNEKPKLERTGHQLRSLITQLFPRNPFATAIPEVFRDESMTKLETFLSSLNGEVDGDVLALVLAMPGSGKTRTVVEASRNVLYRRVRMANLTFEDRASLLRFLHKSALRASGKGGKDIPVTSNRTVVVHFDEIQELMTTTQGSEESLVATLSKGIDLLVNDGVDEESLLNTLLHKKPHATSGPSPSKRTSFTNSTCSRPWLKFVLTGTNIFTRSTIKLGTDVKGLPIELNGAFSLKFVQDLATSNNIGDFFGGDNIGFLERCRHNRRFTQKFFTNLWNGTVSAEGGDARPQIEKAYIDAFSGMKEQMSNQYKKTISKRINVAQVACSVFAKIIAIPESEINDIVYLRNYSEEEKDYIAGGGLNVHSIDEDKGYVAVFYPKGVVLEILEALFGRAASGHTGTTVLSWLRTNRVSRFGLKGHLFEWLVAFDITCAISEINRIMPSWAHRQNSCLGADAKSDPKVYDKIVEEIHAGETPSLWVVLDTHDPRQDRFVDVAYPIEAPEGRGYVGACVMMECKSGYKDEEKKLRSFCDVFFKKAAAFARSHPTIYFVVTFVSECLQEAARPASMPTNMTTVIRVVTSGECPFISNLLGMDFDDNDNHAAACADFDKEKGVKVEVSDKGGDPYMQEVHNLTFRHRRKRQRCYNGSVKVSGENRKSREYILKNEKRF